MKLKGSSSSGRQILQLNEAVVGHHGPLQPNIYFPKPEGH